MTAVRLLLTALLVATSGPAGAGIYACSLQQYSTSVYMNSGSVYVDGRWENRLVKDDKKLELHLTLDEDGSNGATVEHLRLAVKAKGQWSEHLGVITIIERSELGIERSELGNVSILTIFKEVDGKRPANYSAHVRFGYGGAGSYAGLSTSQ
jgi:hypothetical protein